MEQLVIIDGNSLINRAYYALPPLRASDGMSYNAIYGFVNILARLITSAKPKYLCVTFDAGRHTFRNDMYSEYKANRKGMPDDLASQMPVLKDLLHSMGIFTIEKLGIEADDLIGSMTKKFSGVENIIVTGDRDSLQLINQNTQVWLTKQGISETEIMTLDTLKQKMNLKPYQIVELKSLMGDSSDNIPGVPGIGEKTALNLLYEYENLDNIYKNIEKIKGKLQEKLILGKDMGYLSKDLATIRCNIDIDAKLQDLTYTFPWGSEVYDRFAKMEFRSLLKRDELFAKNTEKLDTITSEMIHIESANLPEITLKIKDSKEIALAVYKDKLHFAVNERENYCVDIFGLSEAVVLQNFMPFFTNKNKVIYTYNLKYLYKLADLMQIEIQATVYDVPLAVYLINSNIKENTPEPMLDYFNLSVENLATGLISAKRLAWVKLEQENLAKLYSEIELPLVRVLYEMEREGVCVDVAFLRSLEPKYRQEIQEISQRIYALAGEEFNINSPKQLGVILFEKLGFPDANNKKHSTGVEVLEELRPFHPIIEEILRFRKISKIYSTYIVGLGEYIQNGKIHTKFNQTLTVTGRLSSNEPNLQNIPVKTEEGKELRKIFVASPDNYLISADYSQIELRLLAHFSNDPVLLDAYQKGKDIHSITASQIFGVSVDSVTEEQRRKAKAVNFGIIYGISPYGLSQGLGITQSEARAYINRYFEIYPTIKQFLDSSIEEYKKNNKVYTLLGRIRNFDNIVPKGRDARFSERAAMNMPLQGTASDIIKLAMLSVYDEIKKRGLKAKMILQIHDELILDVPKNEVEIVKEILKSKMENVVKLRVPLPVEIGVGKSWYDI